MIKVNLPIRFTDVILVFAFKAAAKHVSPVSESLGRSVVYTKKQVKTNYCY